jgi:hypothetical protein
MNNILKAFLINIGLFVVLIIVYFISGFLAGYGSNNSYEAESWRLYVAFVIGHLLINFILLKKLKIADIPSVVFSCIEIFILYGIVAWIYK